MKKDSGFVSVSLFVSLIDFIFALFVKLLYSGEVYIIIIKLYHYNKLMKNLRMPFLL